MTYLVTGGTGFIGFHTVRFLERQGEQVVIYDAMPDMDSPDRIGGIETSTKAAVVKGDINDFKHLHDTCRKYGIEKIIHTAAVIGSEDPLKTVRVNCDGTMNILEVSRILGMVRVIVSSSVSVFGPHSKYEEVLIPNDAPHYPQTIYAATKSFNESCVKYYYEKYGLDVIAIRLAHVYGMGRKTKGIGKTIDEELFIKPAIGKHGKVPFGKDIHNYIHVEDAAKALVMASKAKSLKSRVFTAGGHIASIAQLADMVKSYIPEAEITLLPGTADWPYNFDTTPIKEQIGYTPEWTLEQGIQAIITQIQQDDNTYNQD